MEDYKIVIRQASSEIRNIMSLDLELVELITKGSITLEEEVVQTYDPKIHEACEHAPLQIIYEEQRDSGKIKNIDRIRKVVKKSKAKGYILGAPISFGVPASEGDILVASFPVNFYKLRR